MPPTRPETRDGSTFAITVDFVRGQGDPSRPFRTMIGLLDALRRLDRDIAQAFDVSVEPFLVLEDVEAGSIKSWMATVLRSADDDAIKRGDWKKVLGNYLVKAKYVILRRLEGAPTITEPRLLEDIQNELALQAEGSRVGLLVSYTPLTRAQLAAHIAEITTSLSALDRDDTATFEEQDGEPIRFNQNLRVNEEELNALLATRSISNDDELILKVKRPDFLGSSMWEFHFNGHTIHASIADETWQEEFRKTGLGVVPGSALRALVRVQASYSDENDLLPPRYTVLKICEVIPPSRSNEQMRLSAPSDLPVLGGKKSHPPTISA